MSGSGPGSFPGLSDPTKNPEATRAVLKDRNQQGETKRLRPWEEKAIKWLFTLCFVAIVLYGLWELLG